MIAQTLAVRVRRAAIASAGVLLVACGSSKEPTPPPIDPLSISTTPSSLTLAPGASGVVSANIVRDASYTSDVTLAASAPAGVTVTLNPTVLTGSNLSSNVGVAVAASAVAGTYPISIAASGANASTETATFSLIVTGASSTAVSLSYCAADAPLWFAYQLGTGAWTRQTPNAGTNTYQFNATGTRVGVATVDTLGTGYSLRVIYASPAELNGFAGAQTLTNCAAKSITGTMAGVAAGQFMNLSVGPKSRFVTGGSGTIAFTLDSVAAGPLDLVAARVTQATRRIDRMILRRNVDIAAGGALPLLDFAAAEAFAPGTANVTVSGLGADTAFVSTIYAGVRGTTQGFLTTRTNYFAATGTVGYDAVPLDKLGTNDLQQLYAVTTSATAARFSGYYFRGPVDRAITMGALLSTPTVARIAGGAYSRVSAQLPLQAEYNRYASAGYSQTTINRNASIIMTIGYSGGTAWDLSIPDLSAATGWLSTWGLQNGTPIAWSLDALGGVMNILDASIADGSPFRSGRATSSTPLP